MEIFQDLSFRLIPLYGVVALGFFAGRILKIDRVSIAKIVIYLISPIVVFTAVSQIELKASYLLVPFTLAILSSIIAILFLLASRRFGNPDGLSGRMGNLLGFAVGNANTGYFGVPVAMLLFGSEALGLYLLFSLGFLIYENSVGFYILARGTATAREALRRLVRLPALYAFGAAIIANLFHLRITGAAADFSAFFRGTYSILGVMLIGLGVAEVRTFRVDWKFTSATFLGKFLVWPLLMGVFVFADQNYFQIYSEQVHRMLILISLCPLAANTVAFATLLKIEPEKAGVAVLLSTLFALIFIPAVVALTF
jgi:predicted permease